MADFERCGTDSIEQGQLGFSTRVFVPDAGSFKTACFVMSLGTHSE